MAEALFALRRARPDIAIDKPEAYVKRVAKRLRDNAERTIFEGKTWVKRGGKRIGYVRLQSYFRVDGTVNDGMLGQRTSDALPFLPIDPKLDMVATCEDVKARRSRLAAQQLVQPDDCDESRLQQARMAGVTRRDLSAHLGWSAQRVDRVWKRLYRRRIEFVPRRTPACSGRKKIQPGRD